MNQTHSHPNPRIRVRQTRRVVGWRPFGGIPRLLGYPLLGPAGSGRTFPCDAGQESARLRCARPPARRVCRCPERMRPLRRASRRIAAARLDLSRDAVPGGIRSGGTCGAHVRQVDRLRHGCFLPRCSAPRRPRAPLRRPRRAARLLDTSVERRVTSGRCTCRLRTPRSSWWRRVLGDLTGRLTRAMSMWPRYVTRWLAGGLLVAVFWIPAILADELVAYHAAWGGLLLVLPLCLPLVSAVILFAIARPDRGSGL